MGVHEEERRKDLNDIARLMDSREGRRVMFRVLQSSGCLDRPGIISDASAVMYLEGKRSIGFDLFADMMEAAPKKYMVMVLEAKERNEMVTALLEKEKEMNDE